MLFSGTVFKIGTVNGTVKNKQTPQTLKYRVSLKGDIYYEIRYRCKLAISIQVSISLCDYYGNWYVIGTWIFLEDI